jgi:protoporphyrinogen oxidase
VTRRLPVAIIGAGPAGLTAATALTAAGVPVVVIERGDRVGGIARTECYRGYRFDIGGHRFLTKLPEIEALWRSWLGDDLLEVRRLSRIYYGGGFFDYPLRLPNVLGTLGLVESCRIGWSYLASQVWPVAPEESFEDWVTNRFGDRLYRTFFKTYTEKVWGIPCSVIRADWAAQRIQGLSLARAVGHQVLRRARPASLAHAFLYPRLGPGQMWERAADIVRGQAGELWLASTLETIHHEHGQVTSITVSRGHERTRLPVSDVISTAALPSLVRALDPALPPGAAEAAARLRFRDFIIVVLILARERVFPDNWIYIHSPRVKVGRIQNFKNWSAALVPDPTRTSLGLEYFCDAGDAVWSLEDDELKRLATSEMEQIGLAPASLVEDGCVIRQRRAYPVYDVHYRDHVETLRRALGAFRNLQTVGRNGMHRYNNQDHSMLTGLLAAQNVLGADHDLWSVNTDRSYYEEQRVGERRVS